MNKNCLICKYKNNYPICKKCALNAFAVEKCRKILAQKKDFVSLKRMYTKEFKEMTDLNTRIFWNKKLAKIAILDKQDGMTKERISKALSFIPNSGEKLLDVGTGYGFIEELLKNKRYSYQLYGFDISSSSIKNLNRRINGNFVVGSFYNPPFKDSIFDVIFMLEVLEHIPPSQVFFVLNMYKKMLSENGIMVVSVPVNEDLANKKENPSRHVREYSSSLIKAELILSGLKILRFHEFFAFSNFYHVKNFLQKYVLRNRWKPNDIIISCME